MLSELATDHDTDHQSVGDDGSATGGPRPRAPRKPPKKRKATGSATQRARGLLAKGRALREHAGPWPASGSVATKSFLVAVLAGVLCGPAALAWAVWQGPGDTTAAAPAPVADASATEGLPAQQAARHLVRSWLSAGQDDAEAVTSLMIQPPAVLTLPTERPDVVPAVEVQDAAQIEPGLWRVDVAASWPSAQARPVETYRVTVHTTGRDAAAVTLPSRVAPAEPPSGEGDQGGTATVPVSHPAAVTSAGFVTALLSGSQDDLTRWTSPATTVTAVTPAPCSKVDVNRVAAAESAQIPNTPTSGDTARTAVDLVCRTSSGGVSTLHYDLDLTGRDSRWEVTGLSDLPLVPLAKDEANTQPTHSPTPTTSTTPN